MPRVKNSGATRSSARAMRQSNTIGPPCDQYSTPPSGPRTRIGVSTPRSDGRVSKRAPRSRRRSTQSLPPGIRLSEGNGARSAVVTGAVFESSSARGPGRMRSCLVIERGGQAYPGGVTQGMNPGLGARAPGASRAQPIRAKASAITSEAGRRSIANEIVPRPASEPQVSGNRAGSLAGARAFSRCQGRRC